MKLHRVLLGLVFAAAVFAADPTGTWKATVDGPDGPMDLTYKFKLESNQLTGSVMGPMGEFAISDGKVDGENFSFTVDNGEALFHHKMSVTGDDMTLEIDLPDGPIGFAAKRSTE